VQSTTTEHVTDITADVSTSTFTRHDAGTYSGGNYNLSSYCLDYQSSDHYHNAESGTATCSYYPGATAWWLTIDDNLNTDHINKQGAGQVGTAWGRWTEYTTASLTHISVGQDYSGGSWNTQTYSFTSTFTNGTFLMEAGRLGSTNVNTLQYVPAVYDGPQVELNAPAQDVGRPYTGVMDWLLDHTISSQGFGTALNQTDRFVAGWADTLSCGLTTRLRTAMWGDDATKNHTGSAFQIGQIFGMVHSFALGFVSPCGASAIVSMGVRTIDGLQAVGSILNAADSFAQGNYGVALWDSAGAFGSLAGMLRACFAAGTPILTAEGARAIETIKVGDRVLARNEFNPEGPVLAKGVEEVFVRLAPLLHVHVNGQVIRTTGEHPFYAHSKGWIAANQLSVGDWLLTLDGRWIRVDDLLNTGDFATVYNMRVAEYHTYFVGTDGAAVWAHNAYSATSGNNKYARLGQKMHQAYARMLKPLGYKPLRLPSGRIVDAVKIANRIVRELKPNNSRAAARGLRQLNAYVQELQQLYPGKWRVFLDVYV
jgi:hypothetical protein